MDAKKKQFVINNLRRASYKWPPRWKVEKESRVGRNQYKCAMCPEGVVHPKKNTSLDHIQPVVDPEKGFTTFDEYIDRMFVYEEGWQRLCKEHHDIKTQGENAVRKESKKPKKKKSKKTT